MSSQDNDDNNFLNRYKKFRGGRGFLIFLALLIGFWLTWNWMPFLPHFDGPDFGRLNLFLSSEASLSVALLIMANEKQDAVQQKQLEYMLHIMEAVRDHLLEKREKASLAAHQQTGPDEGSDTPSASANLASDNLSSDRR